VAGFVGVTVNATTGIAAQSKTANVTVARKALIEKAAEHNFRLHDVPGDGNCALHAVVHQMSLQGVLIDHKSLRQRAVAFLRDHEYILDHNFLLSCQDNNIDSYLSRQSVDGEWLDEMMMRAVCNCIERNINVLHDNGHTTSLSMAQSDEAGYSNSVNVGLIAETHYVSLVKELRVADVVPIANSNVSQVRQSEASVNQASQSDWPCVWTADKWLEKQQKYPFLKCCNGKLGCISCSSVASIQTYSGKGRNLSDEWVKCLVEPYGKDREAQLCSLRKKIFEHNNSATHMSVEAILRERQKESIETSLTKVINDDRQLTCKALRTAYYLAKNDRPLADYHSLLELQESNGANIGAGLRSRYSATEIVVHISQQMSKRACQQIIKTGGHIAVLVDESTTVDNKSTLIVYLKCMSVPSVEPHFMFLQLIELEDQTAATITKTLLECLSCNGFTTEYLKTHLVAFASDGASVMTGTKSGVARLLGETFPNVIPWHCLNHRLELAVGDAADDVQGISHFKTFLDCLYSLYSRSPKTQKLVETEACELHQQFKKIGRVLSTRWVASSFRTVKAVWNNKEALAAHFHDAADRTSPHYDKAFASKYVGLRKKLCSPEFIVDLGLMYDSLEELSLLSEQLQNRNMSLPEADKLIHRCIRRFESMKVKPGPMMTKAKSYAESLMVKSTKLEVNTKHVPINSKQFLTSVADNLRQRLLLSDRVTAMSNSAVAAATSKVAEEVRRQKLASLLAKLSVLEPNFWPSQMDDDYGEQEVRQLCEHFSLPYGSTRDAYCDYKDSGGKQITQALKPLMHCVKTIPVSTAECERGFSAMNLIATDLRSVLLVKHISALMFIKINGPPLSQWRAENYVDTWLVRHRSVTDTRTRTAAPTCAKEMERPNPLWETL